MSDYEVFEKFCQAARKPFSIPGASRQLTNDIRGSIEEGVSYGVYMWRKHEREEQAYYEKYGKHRRKK